jgi:hypothetical protein
MNVTKLNPTEKEEGIKKILSFYKANKNIPAIFYLGGIMSRIGQLTNSKAKDFSGTRFTIPNTIEIDIIRDNESERKRIFWYGGDNIFTSAKKFTKEDGLFNMPNSAKKIFGNGNRVSVKADTVENERLIEYLLYVAFFFQNGNFLTYDDGGYRNPKKETISAKDKQILFALIDKLSNSKDGKEYLIGLKDKGVFAKNKDNINAMLSEKIEYYIDFIKNTIDVDFVKAKETILPFKEEKELYEKSKKSGFIGYNKQNKAFQIKGADGEFMADTTILVTEEKEEDVVAVLIMNVLKTNEKVKNNLSLMAKK